MRDGAWTRDICPECFAFVYYDMREKHQEWHKVLNEKLETTSRVAHHEHMHIPPPVYK